jgi:hypothetical protein
VKSTYPSKNEKPLLPQPEPSVTVVNTHDALCLLGVRIRRAMQIHIDAMTTVLSAEVLLHDWSYSLLIGANHRMMRCSQLVGKEQIVPNKHKTKMARTTVWCAFLNGGLAQMDSGIDGLRTV